MGKSGRYSKRELEIINEFKDKLTIEELARILERKPQSIHNKLKRTGRTENTNSNSDKTVQNYRKKIKNPFFLSSIILLILGLIFGYHFINNIAFKSPFPLGGSYLGWHDEYEMHINCESSREDEVPVSGDYFLCNVTTTDLNLTDKLIIENTKKYNVEVLTMHYPRSQASLDDEEWLPGYYLDSNITKDAAVFYNIEIPIEQGINNFRIKFETDYFNHENRRITKWYNTGLIEYQAISPDDYDKRQTSKYAAFFTLFGLLMTFSIIGVKNLMNIWDRRI